MRPKADRAHDTALRGLQRRKALRRAVAEVSFPGAHCRLDQLSRAEPALALAFRPQLRAGVQSDGAELGHEAMSFELDDFEAAVIAYCDGRRSLEEVAFLAASDTAPGVPADPVAAAIRFVEALARYDLLETGQQRE